MNRDSFVFRRSFYEALQLMPKEVQVEVYVAIVEYALNGIEPDNLSDLAQGMFILVRADIDSTFTRQNNGKKGASYGKLGGRPKNTEAKPAKVEKPAEVQKPAEMQKAPAPVYSLTLEQEIDYLRDDKLWNEPVCMKFRITADELDARLGEFLLQNQSERDGKPHTNINDAKRHFCSWMRKAYPISQRKTEPADDELPPPSYEFNGGFGGQDI